MDRTRGRRPYALVQWAKVVRQDPAKEDVRGEPSAWAYVAWEDGMSEKTVERCRFTAHRFVG